MQQIINKIDQWLDRNDVVFLIGAGLLFGALLCVVVAFAMSNPELLDSLDRLTADF